MDLNFELFETATLFITVLVVALMLQVRFSALLLSTFYKKLIHLSLQLIGLQLANLHLASGVSLIWASY